MFKDWKWNVRWSPMAGAGPLSRSFDLGKVVIDSQLITADRTQGCGAGLRGTAPATQPPPNIPLPMAVLGLCWLMLASGWLKLAYVGIMLPHAGFMLASCATCRVESAPRRFQVAPSWLKLASRRPKWVSRTSKSLPEPPK